MTTPRAVDIGTMFGADAVTTFLGFPATDDTRAHVAIIGADTATPYASVGPYCAGAPAAIRRAIVPYAANAHHVDFDLDGPILPHGVHAVDHGEHLPDASAREALAERERDDRRFQVRAEHPRRDTARKRRGRLRAAGATTATTALVLRHDDARVAISDT